MIFTKENNILNSEVVLECTEEFLTQGDLETMRREIELLRNAVAYLSNLLDLNQEEMRYAIMYKSGLTSEKK